MAATMIPGAREPGMLTTFGVQPPAVAGGGVTMDAATIASHQKAGGGGPAQRRRARERSRWDIGQRLRQFLTGSRRTRPVSRTVSIALTSAAPIRDSPHHG
jgi:hypothetical protein